MRKSIFTSIALVFCLGLVAAACNHSKESATSTTVATATTTTTDTTATTTTTTTTPPTDTYKLTILHNNDGESKLLPSESKGFPGIARFINKLEALQSDSAASDGVITLTSGDNFLASKELSLSLANPNIFYDAVALSGIYDTMALGNHDFDFGPDVTARFISSFNPSIPFLSSNADFSAEPELQKLVDSGKLAKSVVITKGGTQIGVIGAITQSLPSISSPRNTVIGNVQEAVQAEATRLTNAGVEIIILVSHLQGIGEELELATKLSNVDVIIAGGGDELLKNDGDSCFEAQNAKSEEPEKAYGSYPIVRKDADQNSVLVVTGPGGYRCIGVLNIDFTDGIATNWSGEATGVPLTGPANARVKSEVEDPITQGLAGLDNDIVGISQVELDGRRNSVRTKETNVGNLLTDSYLWSARQFNSLMPQIAISNGGGIRNDAVIEAGNISVSDTFDIAPFGNSVVVMTITRQQLKDLMETTIAGAPDAAGGFAQVGGFRISYDLRKAGREIDRDNNCAVGNTGNRVRNITLDDGTLIVANGVVQSGNDITLATVDFLASGGDCYPLGDIPFTRVGVTYQLSLERYIREGLNKSISSGKYPASGAGRITITK